MNYERKLDYLRSMPKEKLARYFVLSSNVVIRRCDIAMDIQDKIR
jgi:hypothetical protein